MFDNKLRLPSFGSYSSSTPKPFFRRPAGLRAFGIVLGAVIAFEVLGFASRASSVPPADIAAGEQTYKSQCAVCHAADGAGSMTGKALKVPDLRSEAVQKMTTAQMETQISDGKNNMPPFKSTLSKAQIESVVAYVRTTFGKRK
jgi:mono/diheme cytochrome c family protein